MLVAREKRKTNIAEYLLYMWQVEDLIRANGFDIDLIDKNLISQYAQPENVKNDIRDWYTNLLLLMHQEGLRKTGHLSFLNALVKDMNDLHMLLLDNADEVKYQNIFRNAAGNITEFRKKMNNDEANDIETCMNALYGLLLLRLKKKEITRETEMAMATFSQLMAILSKKYLQIEKGEIEL